ncbi:MAG: tetratricopeptide repeat protein [Phycisphaerae bacterium]|jgi:tetratricopeptide (TPR) repeat protein
MIRPAASARATGILWRNEALSVVAITCLLAGCQTQQKTARQAAESRWNDVRAGVKAELAAEQLRAGNYDAAAGEAAKARELAPDDVELKLTQARVLLARGQIGAARELLESIPPQPDPPAEAHYLLGTIHQQLLEWPAAYECFARAAAADRREFAYPAAIAQVLLQQSAAQEAVEYLGSLESQFKALPGYHAALAECHEQLGAWEAAAAAWQRVAGVGGDAGLLERLALAQVRAGQWSDAAETLERLLAQPEAAQRRDLSLALAQCLVETDRFDEARRRLTPLFDGTADSVPALCLLATSLTRQQQLGRALRVADEALHINPLDPDALELAAALALRLGDAPRAAAFARRRLALADGAGAERAREILARCENVPQP